MYYRLWFCLGGIFVLKKFTFLLSFHREGQLTFISHDVNPHHNVLTLILAAFYCPSKLDKNVFHSTFPTFESKVDNSNEVSFLPLPVSAFSIILSSASS